MTDNRATMWQGAANAAALNELLARYEDGYATPYETLRALCMELGEVESDLEPLQAQRERLRTEIGNVLARIGDKAEIKGFGKLSITAPSVSTGYDAKALRALVATWGDTEQARQVQACEKQTVRAGALRIEREKAPARE